MNTTNVHCIKLNEKSKAQISKYCMILVFKNTRGGKLAGNSQSEL